MRQRTGIGHLLVNSWILRDTEVSKVHAMRTIDRKGATPAVQKLRQLQSNRYSVALEKHLQSCCETIWHHSSCGRTSARSINGLKKPTKALNPAKAAEGVNQHEPSAAAEVWCRVLAMQHLESQQPQLPHQPGSPATRQLALFRQHQRRQRRFQAPHSGPGLR